jgi:hypothetical protein
LTSYTKNFTEKALGNVFSSFFTNHTEEVFQTLINNYFNPMVADDDNMAWLQFYVDVCRTWLPVTFSISDSQISDSQKDYIGHFRARF